MCTDQSVSKAYIPAYTCPYLKTRTIDTKQFDECSQLCVYQQESLVGALGTSPYERCASNMGCVSMNVCMTCSDAT